MTEIAPHISVDEKIRFGRPVVSGTRVPVDLILAKLGAGLSFEEVCTEYGVTDEQVRGVLAYAAQAVATEQIRAVR